MCSMIESLKRSKIPLLVLAVLLCVPLFAYSVGASDNLVPTDMREWQVQSYGSSSISYYASGQGNEITLSPQGSTYLSVYLNGVNYIAGHTYQLSFGSTYNEVSEIEWGFAYSTSNGVYEFLSSSDTITTINNMSFVAPNTINSVYVIFSFNGTRTEHIQINHLLCVDVTASEQQAVIDNANENTNKIGGWFSELTTSISEFFTNLADYIKGLFYFEDVIEPVWVPRGINSTTGLVGDSYYASAAATSDFIKPTAYGTISSDGVIRGDLNSNSFRLFVYDTNGTFLRYENFTDEVEITPEYWYRVFTRDYALAPYSSSSSLTTYMNEHVSIVCKSNVFDNLRYGIVNGIKSLLDRLFNLVLYFNADGEYTNPFTFGDIEGVAEYTAHIQGAFDGFNDGINDFVAPIGVVNAVLDEVVGEWGFVAIAVTFVLSALVLIRFLGV